MKPQKGFSLLEIIIAMLILGLVVAGFFSLATTNYKFLVEARLRLCAMNYARKVAEKLKVWVTAEHGPNPLDVGSHNPISSLPGDLELPSPPPPSTCEYTVTESPMADNGLKEVYIKVTVPEP